MQHSELSQLSLSFESVKLSLNEVLDKLANQAKKFDEVLSAVSNLENNFSIIANELEQVSDEEEE